MFKKNMLIIMAGVFCLGLLAGCGLESNTQKITDSTDIIIVDDSNAMEAENFSAGNKEDEDSSASIDDSTKEVVFPVGGMPSKPHEVPVTPSEPGNNWDVSKDKIGITGGSAITYTPHKGNSGEIPGSEHKPGAGSGWGSSSDGSISQADRETAEAKTSEIN